jgi:hypothetical protein
MSMVNGKQTNIHPQHRLKLLNNTPLVNTRVCILIHMTHMRLG